MNIKDILLGKAGYFDGRSRMMFLPSAVTMVGAALSLAWLTHLVPWWIGALGLLCDCLDGPIARKLDHTSDFGSLLDWTVDMVLFVAAISTALPSEYAIIMLLAALPVQVGLRLAGVHFCGRALVFGLLFGREVLR